MSSIAESKSLFEIDAELDELLEEIQQEIENEGQPSPERLDRFQEFCKAHSEKVDRIGRFRRMMEARTLYCRSEAKRLHERAHSSERKCGLESRGLKKIEGVKFTLRKQQNSQDSVRITDEHQIPMPYKIIKVSVAGAEWEQVLDSLPEALKKTLRASVTQTSLSNEAIKQGV
jgi:hypothetical protein